MHNMLFVPSSHRFPILTEQSFFVESHHSDVTLIEKTLHRIESSVIEYAKRTGDKVCILRTAYTITTDQRAAGHAHSRDLSGRRLGPGLHPFRIAA